MQTDSELNDIVVLNPGSSTIKWARFASSEVTESCAEGQSPISALDACLKKLVNQNQVSFYVIRFVHGGDAFSEPTVITDDNFSYLQDVEDLAPLHNNNSLLCVRFLLEHSHAGKIIAVFDTHFFRDLPLVAQSYGLQQALVNKYKIRRYGFHGFSHQFMQNRWNQLNQGVEQYNLVTMQLGSGCSMALIKNGKPIDTTMGFTPNEGLLMSTRSGDIDSCLVTWLQKKESWTPEQTERELNSHSGWFGVSAVSRDFSELLKSNDPKARLAVELFCHRVRKTLGAYHAISGGLGGIVLSGGIAENAADFLLELFKGLEHIGIKLNKTLNSKNQNNGLISARDSEVSCYVFKNNESYVMMHEARAAMI